MKMADVPPGMQRDLKGLEGFEHAMEKISADEKEAADNGEEVIHELAPSMVFRRLLNVKEGTSLLHQADEAAESVEKDANKVAADIANFAKGMDENMKLKGHNDVTGLAEKVIRDKNSVNILNDEQEAAKIAQEAGKKNIDKIGQIDGNQGQVIQFSDFDDEARNTFRGLKKIEQDMADVAQGEDQSYRNGETVIRDLSPTDAY